jgi:hypothetical protein
MVRASSESQPSIPLARLRARSLRDAGVPSRSGQAVARDEQRASANSRSQPGRYRIHDEAAVKR